MVGLIVAKQQGAALQTTCKSSAKEAGILFGVSIEGDAMI
jgi:hypothetical protein